MNPADLDGRDALIFLSGLPVCWLAVWVWRKASRWLVSKCPDSLDT